MIYLDTHVVIWLHALGGDALSPGATHALEQADDIRISPMVRLELQYLFELGRVTEPASTVVDALHTGLGLTVCAAPFPAVSREADRHSWTRDPFDRLIVAQASLHEAPLVTKDEVLHSHYPGSVW
jgi:PIN domain nuclease of toxin-antitoxin system